MKKLIYKKGFILKITSWENDADHYADLEHTVKTVEEAKAIKRMCNSVFQSSGGTPFAIANDYQAGFEEYSEEIINFMSKDIYYKNMDEEKMVDYVSDISYTLLGGSEDYNCRVCEKCQIFEVKEDIYLNLIEI